MQEIKTRIGVNGRLVIPAAYRAAMGLRAGDEVVLRLRDGELHVMSRRVAVKRLQELVRQHVPASQLLSEELSADRRAEAARE